MSSGRVAHRHFPVSFFSQTLLEKKNYKSVVSNGLLQDKNGKLVFVGGYLENLEGDGAPRVCEPRPLSAIRESG